MSRLQVYVIPKAGSNSVQSLPDGRLKVRVRAPAEGGRANLAVIDALAEHFKVPKRAIAIIRGDTSRLKLIEVRQV